MSLARMMQRMPTMPALSVAAAVLCLVACIEARQLQQSDGAQAFYSSFAQKSRQDGPPKLLPLPDAFQTVQKAFKNGQVTNFIQTTGPQDGPGDASDAGDHSIQALESTPGVYQSHAINMPSQVRPEQVMQVAQQAASRFMNQPMQTAEKTMQAAMTTAGNVMVKQGETLQGLPHPVTGKLPGGGNDFAEVGGGSLVLQAGAAAPAVAPAAAGAGLLPPNPLDGVVAVANGFGNVARDAVTQAGVAAGQINNRLGAAAGAPASSLPMLPGQGFAANVQRILNPTATGQAVGNSDARNSALNVAAAQANPLTNAFVTNAAISQTGQLIQDYADHLPDLLPRPTDLLPSQEPIAP